MPSVREEFKLELKNRFSVLSTQNEDTDIEESWKAIKMYIYVWKQVRKYWVLEKINKTVKQIVQMKNLVSYTFRAVTVIPTLCTDKCQQRNYCILFRLMNITLTREYSRRLRIYNIVQDKVKTYFAE